VEKQENGGFWSYVINYVINYVNMIRASSIFQGSGSIISLKFLPDGLYELSEKTERSRLRDAKFSG
jgi:hypothetical protein